MHTNYKLAYCTKNKVWKTYFGETQVYPTQRARGACNVRLKWHLEKPKTCMSGGVEDTFDIQPYGRLLCHRNALCQEVIDTAAGLGTDSSCRGACFARKVMTWPLENTAMQIRRVTKNLSGQLARDAVFKYAESLSEDHPLVSHLENKPYYQQEDEQPGQLVQEKRKTRSGKAGCRTRQKQLARGDYSHGDATHRRLKHGANPSEKVKDGNDRRKVPRQSGIRKKPARGPCTTLSARKKN
jgi:hypothetical protein